jgi:SRSO17 transposase
MEAETTSSWLSLEALWTSLFDALCERIDPCFARSETREGIKAYLRGLLSPVERKNGWQLAEEAGYAMPYAMQYLFNRAWWDSEMLRDQFQAYVREMLAGPDGIVVIDETGFLKKGKKSVGVQRQWQDALKTAKSFFLTDACQGEHTLVDRELYLSKGWTQDRERCQAAHVPEKTGLCHQI